MRNLYFIMDYVYKFDYFDQEVFWDGNKNKKRQVIVRGHLSLFLLWAKNVETFITTKICGKF
jgi:hypothetical protein